MWDMSTTERGELVVGGVEVGGYEVERFADGTVRAAFWGLCALLAAQAELDAAVRATAPVVVDAVACSVMA